MEVNAEKWKSDQFKGDLKGGSVGAFLMIPIILSCGVALFQNLGSAYASAGIMAALISALTYSLIAGLFGGKTLHVSCPKTSHAIILAGMAASISGQEVFSDYFKDSLQDAAVFQVLISMTTLFISGLLQIGIGILNMGGLVKFLPYPVLAGIVNGLALQIIIGQLPAALGESSLSQAWVHGTSGFNGLPVTLALVTILSFILSNRLIKAVPPAMIGLVFGMLAYLFIEKVLGTHTHAQLIGKFSFSSGLDISFEKIGQMIVSPVFYRNVPTIASTAFSLAIISSLQSLISISAADAIRHTSHDGKHELMMQGATNLLSATLIGSPSGGSPNITKAVHANGGSTNLANLSIGACLALMFYGLSPLIEALPLAVLAGIVIASTAQSLDTWTHKLILRFSAESDSSRSDIFINLLVVFTVAVSVITEGVLAALGIGMLLILMIFLYRTNKAIINKVIHMEAQINGKTSKISEIQLHGYFYFGNCEIVTKRFEIEMENSTCIILNMRNCQFIDTSAAMSLKKFNQIVKQKRKIFLITGLPPGNRCREYLFNVGVDEMDKEGRIFSDDVFVSTFLKNKLSAVECSCNVATPVRTPRRSLTT